MLGASSSIPKADLKRSFAGAVDEVSTNMHGGHRPLSRTTAIVGATLAVGVSVVVGGRLIYNASHRTDKDEEDKAATTVPSAEAAPSWWQRALSHLLLSRAAEDDDDVFASGTGAANLFDEEKTRARKFSRDRSKSDGRVSGITASAQPHKSERLGNKLPSRRHGGELTAVEYPADIQEREQHIKLVRALLRRQAGIEYSDDGSSTSSDSTDVSLNYHFATTMEATARDDLLRAFAAYEECNDGLVLGSTSRREDAEGESDELQVNILIKTLEYLDMSNEREKLRCRRIALYREQGRATPASSANAAGGNEDDGEKDDDTINAMYRQLAARNILQHPFQRFGDEDDEDGDDMGLDHDHDFPNAAVRQARQFQAMFEPSMMGMKPLMKQEKNTDDSVLDRILGQASAGAADAAKKNAAYDRDEDMMEEEWEDEDDDEEADFMAYLQQPDDAEHFYSRKELRQARRDPDSDVRVVGPHGTTYGLNDGEADNEDDWEDDGEEDEGGKGEEEEDDFAPSAPWSRHDKADFERELFGRIDQLAHAYTLTAAMAEMEADEEDARRLVRREQLRRQQKQQKSRAVPTVKTTGEVSQPLEAVAEDDEGWEDEGEWEDEDDG